jgi:hypothetical protein
VKTHGPFALPNYVVSMILHPIRESDSPQQARNGPSNRNVYVTNDHFIHGQWKKNRNRYHEAEYNWQNKTFEMDLL